jgi:hypothetical protein
MLGPRLRRHITSIQRSRDEARPTKWDVHLEIDLRSHDACTRLDGGASSGMPGLADAAEALYASVLSMVPRRRRMDVVVESGRVTDQIIRRGRILDVQEQAFLFAACGGTMLELTDGLIPSNVAGIPSEISIVCLLGMDVPVALSPCATLSLIEHCSDDDDQGTQNAELNSRVSISHQPWSPYPPHRAPESLLLNELLGDCDDAMHKDRSPPIDPRPYLSIRPDLWSQPFGALLAGFGGVKALCGITTVPPPRVLLLDAVIPLSNGTGRRECEVEFSILNHGHREAMGEHPVTLSIEVGKLISSVVSAIGEAQPGAAFDPITGNRFGMAPILLTTIRSRELMESVQ